MDCPVTYAARRRYTYIQSESASQGAGEYPVGNADVDADGNPRAGGDVDWINDCVLGFWGADYNESPAELYAGRWEDDPLESEV